MSAEPKKSFVRVARGGSLPANVAVVWLEREPVNSMTLELWTALADALTALENDETVRERVTRRCKDPSTDFRPRAQVEGVIFASGLRRNVFTAGNDITELYAPKTTKKRYRAFWMAQTRFLSRLLTTKLSTVCAIRGACPAGGCVVALCCDYRVQTTEGTFGLNEVALGISVPRYWADLFLARCIDRVKGERLLQLGVLLNPKEALDLGLIDQIVGEGALMAAAQSALERFTKVPSGARATTKDTIRSRFSAEWLAYGEEEAREGWKMLNEPHIVAALGGVLLRLSGGKAKL